MEEQKRKEPRCDNCGATSQQRPLISYLNKDQEKWVCMRCLPMLIHGAYEG